MELENDIVDIQGIEFKLLLIRVLHNKVKSPARLIVSNRDSVVVSMLSQRVRDGALALSIRSVDDKRAPPPGVGVRLLLFLFCANSSHQRDMFAPKSITV